MAESDYQPQPEFPEDAQYANEMASLRESLAKAIKNYADNDSAILRNPALAEGNPNAAHDIYAANVRALRDKNPSLFADLQAQNTDAQIERLNKLQLEEKSVFGGFDDYLSDVSRMKGQVAFGSENSTYMDGNSTRGITMQSGENPAFYVGGKTPIETSYHEALHSVLPVATDENGVRFVDARYGEVIPEETLARSFDYVRAVLNKDKETADRAFKYAKRIYRGEAPMYGTTLVGFALSAMNQMFAYDMIPKEYRNAPEVQEALEYFDEEGQGVLESLIGKDPEKQEKVTAKVQPRLNREASKHLVTLMELAKAFSFEGPDGWDEEVTVDLNRDGFESTIK